jgi:hypothetical protein
VASPTQLTGAVESWRLPPVTYAAGASKAKPTTLAHSKISRADAVCIRTSFGFAHWVCAASSFINVAEIRKGRLGRGPKPPLIDKPIEKRREIALARGSALDSIK